MTLQQMEYLVALYQLRHFGQAAEHCGVSQPSLSAMIQKTEDELGTRLFDRPKRSPIVPTMVCHNVVRQAQIALAAAKKINEVAAAESTLLNGELHLGIIPTLAPYIVPGFVQHFRAECPEVALQIVEGRTVHLLQELLEGKFDMLLCATPLGNKDVFEIPIYYERFVAYFSPLTPAPEGAISNNFDDLDEQLQYGKKTDKAGVGLWVLQEGHCLRSQMFNFCGKERPYNRTYEAGSIDTLIRIIDENGGYSVIPELHIPYLTEEQRKGVRQIEDPPAVREVSLVVRTDFVRERLVNAVANVLKKVVPNELINERLKKFSIKL